VPLARHRVVGSPTPTRIYVLLLATQLCAVSPRALSGQAITEFCVRQGVRFCPRGSVRWYVTERAWFSQRRIARNYALPTVNSCERQAIAEFCARQGVRFCPRGSVRWYVTERAWFSQRSIVRNYALSAVNSCERQAITEFCVRQGVRFCPRGSVRWYVTERAWFSQRSITQNYALPDISRCLRGRPCSSPQCIPHHCRAERRRHPAEPEPARQLPCRPSRRSHRT